MHGKGRGVEGVCVCAVSLWLLAFSYPLNILYICVIQVVCVVLSKFLRQLAARTKRFVRVCLYQQLLNEFVQVK